MTTQDELDENSDDQEVEAAVYDQNVQLEDVPYEKLLFNHHHNHYISGFGNMKKITESSSVATTRRSDNEIRPLQSKAAGGEKILKTRITQNEDGRSKKITSTMIDAAEAKNKDITGKKKVGGGQAVGFGGQDIMPVNGDDGNEHFNEERPTMSIDEIFDEYGGSGEQQQIFGEGSRQQELLDHDAHHQFDGGAENLKVTIN